MGKSSSTVDTPVTEKTAVESAGRIDPKTLDSTLATPATGGSSFSVEMWPTEKPKDYPNNARKITFEAVTKVAKSIREFGFRAPIVVDENGVIIIGHVRRRGARRLKLQEVPVHVAKGLSPEKVRLLRIADNRTHEETSWDNDLLKKEMSEIQLDNLDLDLTLTAFDDLQLAKMLDDPDVEPSRNSGGDDAGLEFRIIVECESEEKQTELLERFETEGLKCKPLIN